MNYFILKQDRLVPDVAGIGEIPESIDPLDWVEGKVMPAPEVPVRIGLSEASGSFRGDIIQSFVTLYSNRLRDALSAFGVDNLQYFTAELEDPRTGGLEQGYWLTNVVGLIECVDLERSTFKPRRSGNGIVLKGFSIDERRAPEQPIFRLNEDPTLVIINERLKRYLDDAKLAGVNMEPTEEYRGVS